MIRVMIVEDEPPIAQSIKRLAEQYSERIQVVHTAINGKRALEYLAGNPVDLIFSDIKMPVMGGLDLARQIHQDYPALMMVIISGFQEFEFARTAIRFGVSNYLLKPVSKEHIAEVLDTACAVIRERREQEIRQLLERAVSGEPTPALSHDGGLFGVALICGGAYPLIPDEGLPENRDLWSTADIEEHLKQHAGEDCTCICIHGQSQRERAVVFGIREKAAVASLGGELYDWLASRGEIAVTMAVWEKPVVLDDAADILSKLRKRIYKRILLFRSQLMTGGKREANTFGAAEERSALVLALKTRDLSTIQVAVAALVDASVYENARQAELVLCLEKTLTTFFDDTLTMGQMEELHFEIRSAITTSLRPSELSEELSQVLYSWVSADVEMENSSTRELCEEVAAYLRVHYRENIRGTDLARQFGHSSTQIAKKFKDCFHVSISEYVNSFRIESAQAMMRDNRKRMIKEIALEVGYNDQYYFSKIFKKITGVWPTEYLNPKA